MRGRKNTLARSRRAVTSGLRTLNRLGAACFQPRCLPPAQSRNVRGVVGDRMSLIAASTAAAALRCGAWCIAPAAHAELLKLVDAAAAGRAPRAAARRPGPVAPRGVAVIPIVGTLTQYPTPWSGASTEQVGAALLGAVADPAVQRILLYVDSPGGEAYGAPELANLVYALRSDKPIAAYVAGQAASAAYWIAAQAGKVYAAPTAEVGGIGVVAAHADLSAAMSKQGVKVTLIAAGKYKTEASPFAPLDKDARAHLQRRCDDVLGMMLADIARGRGAKVDAVRDGMGQGRMLGAKDALAAGMIDAVATIQEVLTGRLAAPTPQQGQRTVALVPPPAAPDPVLLRHARRLLDLH